MKGKKPSVAQLKAREAFIERYHKGGAKPASEKRLEGEISKATGKPWKGKR